MASNSSGSGIDSNRFSFLIIIKPAEKYRTIFYNKVLEWIFQNTNELEKDKSKV